MKIPKDIATHFARVIQCNLEAGRIEHAHISIERAVEDAIERRDFEVSIETYLDNILDADFVTRLGRMRIHTVGELLEYSYADLLKRRGISKRSVDKIAEAVRLKGYPMKGDPRAAKKKKKKRAAVHRAKRPRQQRGDG